MNSSDPQSATGSLGLDQVTDTSGETQLKHSPCKMLTSLQYSSTPVGAARGLIALPLVSVFGHVMLANGCLLLVLIRVEALWSPIVSDADVSHSLSFIAGVHASTRHGTGPLRRYLSPAEVQAADGPLLLPGPLPFHCAPEWFCHGVLVALAGSLDFCGSRVIEHLYCDHMALVHLGCGDTEPSQRAGVAVIVCFVGLDIPVIVLSYLQILIVVHRAGEDRWKALHTCGTHLMVLLVFYLVGTVAFLSHTMRLGLSSDLNTLMGLVYILLPAAVNPVIYGVRTAEIRQGFSRVFGKVLWARNTSKKMSIIKVCPWTNPAHRGSAPLSI
ncbi:hypothetical protein WMY93_028909 [Mugilogobius chulae]|uniref:G-protein coupled receptors family 1 profile domain-containing protein n=1 Tax=Mugilogobius chulae TaxID=88201 RepID=A0AAW0MRL3_9GOBI